MHYVEAIAIRDRHRPRVRRRWLSPPQRWPGVSGGWLALTWPWPVLALRRLRGRAGLACRAERLAARPAARPDARPARCVACDEAWPCPPHRQAGEALRRMLRDVISTDTRRHW
jgi:hypothetical protein